MSRSLPLAGITVVSLEQAVAAPFATRQLSVTGSPEHPAKVGVSIADICAGMYAYTGILTALLHRGSTGVGDVLEISMLEALGEWMSQPYFYAEYGGNPPSRSGAQHASIAPYGPFTVADGTVFFGIQNDREWAIFCDRVSRNSGYRMGRVPDVGEHTDAVLAEFGLHGDVEPAGALDHRPQVVQI